MVKTRYELLQETKRLGLFTPLISSGCMSLNIATWLTYYDTYKEELKSNAKSVSVQYTADFYNVSIPLIYKIVSFLENKIIQNEKEKTN